MEIHIDLDATPIPPVKAPSTDTIRAAATGCPTARTEVLEMARQAGRDGKVPAWVVCLHHYAPGHRPVAPYCELQDSCYGALREGRATQGEER